MGFMKLLESSDQDLNVASAVLKKGGLVAFPTETVYGLGADAFCDSACRRIFEVKGRPEFNPLIVHCRNLKEIENFAEIDERAFNLANEFWPGPLTLVLKKRDKSSLSSYVTAGLDTVAVRIPGHSIAQKLLEIFGSPIAAPSANLSGQLSSTTAAHVVKSLGSRVDIILKSAGGEIGLESTIIDLSDLKPALLRAGGFEIERIESCLGESLIRSSEDRVKSPGQLLRHYAPLHPIRINVTEVHEDEGLLAFGEELKGSKISLNLSKAEDLTEAARTLFKALHILDERADITGIAVQPIPERGLGIAINDRLRRAAAGSAFNDFR